MAKSQQLIKIWRNIVNRNVFKVLMGLFGLLVLYSICSGPKDYTRQNRRDNYNVNVQTLVSASDGLDLKAVGQLVKKAKTAEQLEKLLNSKNEGINNLDLNEDGKVDYIHVTEYGTDKVKGMSLTVQPTPGETQEVATIEIEKDTDSSANMQVRGNEQIYGQHHYHHSRFGLTDMLILGYLFRPHRAYASPWGYGHYPNYHSPYNTSSHRDYNRDMRNRTSGSSFRSSKSSTISGSAASPNYGKSAKSIRAPLKKPTVSQKSFQTRNPSKQVRQGGFGRSKTRSTQTSRSSVRRSSSRRSGGFSRGK